ncbi:LOW QUALITY PROTEIN: phospholipid-transporting ATPase ABCA3-like [Drosophila obscura]|uniref:LOW QUALITY PROTEIN: phospholipid-transporting ATPase ABCA3-like n=1 Tax=Drosophila obscura TaxID=7282 RepID=UPI001BB0E5DE|nr:LOW QUALITY PROTEIN: phospholipid-transporting ATPase ABCA3-like [Drosophila obscura]
MDVKSIVEEKELQLKDMLNISDVSNSLQWLAWYVKSMIVLFIISLAITIFWTMIGIPGEEGSPFADMPVLPYTDSSVFLLYLLVCSHSFICFGFLVSSFCTRSNWCGIIAILLFMASCVPNFVTSRDSTGTLLNILCSIFVVSAMNMVMDRIILWEYEGVGLHWSNIFQTSWARDSISVGAILFLMILFSLISILICLYMERVRPGEFGMPQPWNFPCTKRFWCPTKNIRRVVSLSPPGLFLVQPTDEERRSADKSPERKTSKFVDASAKGKTPGVQIKNLSKSFGERQVVAGLTFDLFENEITVLLGHNGAGKTTTIQMLTGTIQPSSGTAIINGYDIQTEHLQARRSLGICPQRSVFFAGLSVASHLRFYSRLRGLKGAAVKQEVEKYLQKLSLKEKANTAARRLSGGTQRRLALACALCGNVKVLFCDEPSSGLDPNSRLELWKLLLDEKQGRTVLLTTHQMDEGEVLADRIAIISDGRLRCLGTLAFLKKQNETSYLLSCEKGPNCNVSRLTQLIAAHVPNTRPHSNIGSDVSYRLPHRFLGSFGSLFNDLEQQKEQLDVVGFGLSSTSLSEIFMSHGAEDLGARTSGGGGSVQQRRSQRQSQGQEQSRHPNRFLRYLGQWEDMLLKKLLYTYDKKWMFLVMLLLPIVLFVVVLIRRPSASALLARLPLTLADYNGEEVKVILQSTSDTRPVRDIANAYQELAQQHCTVERISQNVIDYIGPQVQGTPARIYEMKQRLIAAATFDQETIVWCRQRLFPHSAPVSLNLAFNAMAKAMVGSEASIEVTNAPYEGLSQVEQHLEMIVSASIYVLLYLSIVLAIFSISVAQERVTQIRMQQQVSGVSLATYWLTHFIIDLSLYFAFALTLILAVHELCHPGEMLSILMIIGVAGLPFTYIMASLFRDAGTAVIIIANINMIFAPAKPLCFGLLGANGAGKTTTFKMIVGDIAMTMGSIHVRGCSMKFRPIAARRQIGYCPRTTRSSTSAQAVKHSGSSFCCAAHAGISSKKSRKSWPPTLAFLRTKRKLNAAVAGEGSSLICLDEPSSGVDPASRRHVWNVLSSLRDKGKAVLLSSHSMEEVEALCTQLAIMVDGKIHCLGSQQRIKNKFAQCLVIKLHVDTGSLESMAYTVLKVKNQMESDFPTASLEEEFGGRLTYHIPIAKMRWSRVFSYVERNRSPWKVVDYSLTQPSLEDVFLDIAKKKANEKKQQKNQNRQPKSRPTKKDSPKSDKDNSRATRLTKT